MSRDPVQLDGEMDPQTFVVMNVEIDGPAGLKLVLNFAPCCHLKTELLKLEGRQRPGP